jgi:hypothetical protein
MRTPKRLRSVRLWIFLLVLFATGFVIVDLSRPPALLGKATRVADASSWGLTIQNWRNGTTLGIINRYDWITDREVLVFLHTGPAVMSWTQTGAFVAFQDMEGDPTAYDVERHQYRPLAELARLFRKTHGHTGNFTTHLSPNGESLLWSSTGGQQHLARLDGNQASHWSNVGAFWSSDNLVYEHVRNSDDYQWLGLKRRDTGAVYRSGHFERVRAINETLTYQFEYPDVGNLYFPVVQQKDRLEIIERSLVRGRPEHTYTGKLPRKGSVLTVLLSPDGGRFLWVLLEKPGSRFGQFLSRHFPRVFGSDKVLTTSIWVSNTKGGNMQEVGEMSAEGPYPAFEPQLVRWLPGGNCISFFYDKSLWTVPVP